MARRCQRRCDVVVPDKFQCQVGSLHTIGRLLNSRSTRDAQLRHTARHTRSAETLRSHVMEPTPPPH